MNKCKGNCDRLEGYETTLVNRDAFIKGFYRCRTCDIFIKNVTRCPCCNSPMSFKPRNNKSRRNLNEINQVVRH
jgi:hypothetical protein